MTPHRLNPYHQWNFFHLEIPPLGMPWYSGYWGRRPHSLCGFRLPIIIVFDVAHPDTPPGYSIGYPPGILLTVQPHIWCIILILYSSPQNRAPPLLKCTCRIIYPGFSTLNLGYKSWIYQYFIYSIVAIDENIKIKLNFKPLLRAFCIFLLNQVSDNL